MELVKGIRLANGNKVEEEEEDTDPTEPPVPPKENGNG